jgi:hypothetical protein
LNAVAKVRLIQLAIDGLEVEVASLGPENLSAPLTPERPVDKMPVALDVGTQCVLGCRVRTADVCDQRPPNGIWGTVKHAM